MYVIMLARLPTMQIMALIGEVGASPQIGEILSPCDFSESCSYLFYSIRRPGRTAGPIISLFGLNDVLLPKDGPLGGQNDGWPYLGNVRQSSPKWA